MYKTYKIVNGDSTFFAECEISKDVITCRNLTLHDSREQMVIMCCETYEIWANANQACKAHNIPPGRMSYHLNKQRDHKFIKGRSYQRVTLSSVGGPQALAAGKVQACTSGGAQ